MPSVKTQPTPPARADRPAWTPPEAPTLTGPEAARAIESGGLPGVIAAIRNKAAAPIMGHADVASFADSIIDQYRAGSGGPDREVIMANLERAIVAADVMVKALEAVAAWVDANPGSVVVDAAHSTGRRRVFN